MRIMVVEDDVSLRHALGAFFRSTGVQVVAQPADGLEAATAGEDLEPIEWWRWFQEFERKQLQLVYLPSKGWFTMASRLAPTGA